MLAGIEEYLKALPVDVQNRLLWERWHAPGHRDRNEPMIVHLLRQAPRKNGKSGLIALLLLCHLVGPLRRHGWRGLVVSLTGRLAMELWRAMQEIADVNDLPVEYLAIAEWAESQLIIPSRLNAGEPLRLAEWQIEWLKGALAPDFREAGLSIAR